MADPTDPPAPTPARPGSGHRKLATSVFVALAGLLTLMLVQQNLGLPLVWVFEPIPPGQVSREDGVYRFKLPKDYRGRTVDARGRLLENGLRLPNKARRAGEVADIGPGTFHIQRGVVRFLPMGGGDPRNHGASYQPVLPVQCGDRILGGLGAATLAAALWAARMRRRGPEDRPGTGSAVRPGRLALAAAGLALVAGAVPLAFPPPYSSGPMRIKGIPESDAAAWHTMAEGLAEGQGLTTHFSANRPLYAVLLGGAYMAGGPSLAAAKSIHLLGLALAAAGIVLIAAALRIRAAGFAVVGFLVLGADHILLPQTILTENAGLWFSVLAVLSLWLGLVRLSPLWCLAGGLANGLGNLASGVMLLSLPFFGLWLLANLVARRVAWRRFVLMSLAYGCGALAVLAPWLVRQRIVIGHYTLAFNSAELLYGGASPEGKLTADMHREAARAGVPESEPGPRYRWFAERYGAVVAADPAGYLRRVLSSAWEAFPRLPSNDPALRTLGLLVLLGTVIQGVVRRASAGEAIAGAALAAAWLQVPEFPGAPVFVLAAGLCLQRARGRDERSLVWLLVLAVLSLALLCGLAGGIARSRFWPVGDWALALLVFAGLGRMVQLAGLGLDRALGRTGLFARTEHAGPGEAAAGSLASALTRPSAAVVLVLLGFSALAAAATGIRTALGPRPQWPGIETVDPAALMSEALHQHPDNRLHGPAAPKRMKALLVVAGDQIARIEAHEAFGHWMSHYDPRPYPRRLALLARIDGAGPPNGHVVAQIRDTETRIPEGVPLLWVAVAGDGRNRISGNPMTVLESVAAIPLREDGPGHWRIDFARGVYFPLTPEAEKAADLAPGGGPEPWSPGRPPEP